MLWRRNRMPSLVGLLGLTFLLYASLSILWSANASPAWPTIALLSLVASFALGARFPRAVETILVSFLLVVILTIVPLSLFINHNILGGAVALAIAIAITYRYYWFVPFGLLGHAITQSRGAIFATGAALLVVLYRYSPKIVSAVIVAAVIAVAYFGTMPSSLFARIGVWQDTINHLTIFGSGWGGFETAYLAFPIHTNMTETHPQHVYNDVLELLFELGVGTIPLWLFLILCLEGTSNLLVWTFFALGLSFFPLYIFPLGQLFALILGQIYHERKLYGSLAPYSPTLSQRSRYGMGT